MSTFDSTKLPRRDIIAGINTRKFYVGSGNSSRELPIDEIPKYIGERFKHSA